jgi:tetratricopeptide (TPR) repeat protein
MNRQQRRAAGIGRSQINAGQIIDAAVAHHQAGRVEHAATFYRAALSLDPEHPDALHLLGVASHQTGDPETAVNLISHAIRRRPGAAIFHSNLGNALRDLGHSDQAISSLRRAVHIDGCFADGRYNLGVALQAAERIEEAAREYRAAIALRPDHAESHDNLGTVLKAAGRLSEAERCHREALRLRPVFPGALTNVGIVLKEQGNLADAETWCRRAVEHDPKYKQGHFNLGAILSERGEKEAALGHYRQAVGLDHSFAAARYNLALALLSLGQMEEGWAEYEWRWKVAGEGPAPHAFLQPAWRGEPGEGRTLLVHSEQGYGDTLQFSRYAPMAAAQGLEVILQIDKPLVRLMGSLDGVSRVVPTGEPIPRFDMQCPMLSLPLALGTTLATVPATIPYLAPTPADAATWRRRLDDVGASRPRIGLAWAGNSLLKADKKRSLGTSQLDAILQVPGASFISLQKIASSRPDARITDFMTDSLDFADTAALIDCLDLVIAVDTAVVHLAGALGKRVWMLDRFDPCWRWLHGRTNSPWYPKMRIYRQAEPGAWAPVIEQVAADLATEIRAWR